MPSIIKKMQDAVPEEIIKEFASEAVERKVYDIDDVEIFSAGTWNGDEYTVADLDDMVESFAAIGNKIKPFIKLGHDEGQALLQKDGMPAAGWITNVKRVGEKLLAKFSGVPEKIYELIKKKAYGRFSSEIYWNLKDGANTYKRVLRGVALLGGDTPAVTNLDDFISLYIENADYDKLKIYNEKESIMDDLKIYKEQISALETEIKTYKVKVESLEKENVEAKAYIEKAKHDAKAAEVKAYIDGKVKDGVIIPAQVEKLTVLAMADLASVKAVFDAQQPQVKMNTSSEAIKPEVKEDEKMSEFANEDLDKKIKVYMKENKVSYSAAFDEVTKGGK